MYSRFPCYFYPLVLHTYLWHRKKGRWIIRSASFINFDHISCNLNFVHHRRTSNMFKYQIKLVLSKLWIRRWSQAAGCTVDDPGAVGCWQCEWGLDERILPTYSILQPIVQQLMEAPLARVLIFFYITNLTFKWSRFVLHCVRWVLSKKWISNTSNKTNKK